MTVLHLSHTILPCIQSIYTVIVCTMLLTMLYQTPRPCGGWSHCLLSMLTRNHCSSCLSLGPRLLLPVAFCAKDLPPSPYLNLTPFPRTVVVSLQTSSLLSSSPAPNSLPLSSELNVLLCSSFRVPHHTHTHTLTVAPLLLPFPSEPSARVGNSGFL